jgi:hypothetical protein
MLPRRINQLVGQPVWHAFADRLAQNQACVEERKVIKENSRVGASLGRILSGTD